ncbi:hypothetical protein BH20GEM2_BH20GEM2_11320 [soil metagenome]
MTTPLRLLNRVLLLVGCVICSGCFRWASISAPIPANKTWGYVRIVRQDSGNFTYVNDARVTRDTLSGTHSAGTTAAGTPARIPVKEIRHIEHSSFDVVRTGSVVVGSFAAAILAVFLSLKDAGDF